MKCKIGIRPVIDGRCGGIRESLETQTMNMAKSAKALIENNCFYSDGTPVECVISNTTIGGSAEACKCEEQFDWPENGFVHFNFIADGQVVKFSRLNLFWQALNCTLILRKLIIKYRVRQVFVTNLGIMMPFVPLFLPRGTRVSGVLYRIYLYEWAKSNWKKRMQDALKFYLMARCKRIEHPFLLNDAIASTYLNRKFYTKKFEEIIDPMNVINYTPRNTRSELGVDKKQRLFVHLGGLGGRKGTMNIIGAMEKMTIDELKQNVFVFAGKVGNDIRTEFYQRIQPLQKNANVKIFDGRIPFEQMADLCYSCDAILLPSSLTMPVSSGVYPSSVRICSIG